MPRLTMRARVRVASTGEVTTLAALADAGRLVFTTCLMDGPKRGGERKVVRRYFADLNDEPSTDASTSTGWEIGEMAYKSRTGQLNSTED